YGDGVFETMLLQNGEVRFVGDHLQRLRRGCERLKILMPHGEVLQAEMQKLIQQHRDGIIKLIVTRGRGGRGYRASGNEVTHLWQVFSPVVPPAAGITLRWCDTRLARNEQLAGIKHLNRLEQVMAQSEWNDASISEGLMLDTEGELISGTMSNVFMMIDDVLVTPDLRFSGVQGVLRKNVLRMADELKISVEERPVRPEELLPASEVFVTNAVRGIQPVVALMPSVLDELRWSVGVSTMKLMKKLNERD
ncbi:MAG: aminodeoxychorismate lyase, partial [Steroidobacter sp.]